MVRSIKNVHPIDERLMRKLSIPTPKCWVFLSQKRSILKGSLSNNLIWGSNFYLIKPINLIMPMLDRYKKKGGFNQLLQLIETSGKTKQEQFLALIAQESPVWEETLRKKWITLDKVLSWSPVYLAEIFSRIQILTLASAFHGYPEDKLAIILEAVSATEQRKFQMTLQEINPNPAEKATSQMKILSETRGLIAKGIIKLDKLDPELVIPENIEEKLSEAGYQLTVNAPQSEATTELKFDSKAEAKADTSKEEIDFLRKKVNQLVNENNLLKHELSVLRNKIEQIKKIA